MQKPSAETVIALTGTGLAAAVVSAVIDDAALLAEKCIRNLPGGRQEAILKWLAAHMLASTSDSGSQVLASTSLGAASDSFARGSLGDGLQSTTYGQQAIALDPSGCLARLGRARATIEVV
jgi:hypothetical protein